MPKVSFLNKSLTTAIALTFAGSGAALAGTTTALIDQDGSNNAAFIEQVGVDHYGAIDQSGPNNDAGINQTAAGHVAVINQDATRFGSGNWARVNQNTNEGANPGVATASIDQQGGKYGRNVASIDQTASNDINGSMNASIDQWGSRNEAYIDQNMWGKESLNAQIDQSGYGNFASQEQRFSGGSAVATALISQTGKNNSATQVQKGSSAEFYASATQSGWGNTAFQSQISSGAPGNLVSVINQTGYGNSASTVQSH